MRTGWPERHARRRSSTTREIVVRKPPKDRITCKWACGNTVPKAHSRSMCGACVVFYKRYSAMSQKLGMAGYGLRVDCPERESRVEVYAKRAEKKLPLFEEVAA